MDIKAVIFDVGETLIYYNNFLDWQSLYPPAIKQVMTACDIDYDINADEVAQKILKKYNTRINYREHEVSSDIIFMEILNSWHIGTEKLQAAKQAFYAYFQRDAKYYDDTVYVLQSLKNCGIKTGILTDVAYGMDNEYALSDLESIKVYIDICLTSNDVGYRKPNTKGYLTLQKFFNVPSNQIAFIGNEEKDIVGAVNAGFISILIDRDKSEKNWGQKFTINTLSEVLNIFEAFSCPN